MIVNVGAAGLKKGGRGQLDKEMLLVEAAPADVQAPCGHVEATCLPGEECSVERVHGRVLGHFCLGGE